MLLAVLLPCWHRDGCAGPDMGSVETLAVQAQSDAENTAKRQSGKNLSLPRASLMLGMLVFGSAL